MLMAFEFKEIYGVLSLGGVVARREM